MKKALFRPLSILLILFILCCSFPIVTSAESAWYYKDIDFSESQYANGANLSNQVSGGTTIENGAVKITAIKGNKSNARNQSACIRLVDETGDNSGQLWLTPGKDYRVSFDINVVSSTSSLINVGYKRLNNGNMPVGTTALTFVNDLSWNTSAVAGQGYIRRSFEFSTTDITDTNRRLLLFVFTNNSGKTDYSCEIYIDNIVIEEKVAITYSGDEDTTGLPTTAWAAQTWEEVLGDNVGEWCTDSEGTVPATGIINNNAVTLYPKAKAEEKYYYTTIDFSESQYPSNHLYNASLVDDIDPNHGKSVKITSIKGSKNDAKYASACIRLVDETGANNGQLYLKPNTKYRISFDIKVVSSESTIVSVGVKNLTNNNIPEGTETTFLTPTHYNTSDLVEKGYVRKEIEIDNIKGNLNTRALFFVYSNNTGRTDYECEIYIDNVTIAEKVDITCNGITVGDLKNVYANQTWEEVLGASRSYLYLDEELTENPTGIINANKVTLYSKYGAVTKSYDLFRNDSKAELSDAQGNNMKTNSVVYTDKDGVERTAFRFVASFKYFEGDDGNYYADEALTIKIVKRGMKIGVVENGVYTQKTKSEKAANAAAWSNKNGVLDYSFKMFNISKEKKGVVYYATPYLVVEIDGIGEKTVEYATFENSVQGIYDISDAKKYAFTWYAE